jgi:hypothetical protein
MIYVHMEQSKSKTSVSQTLNNSNRMIKSRRMRWAGHEARMVEKRNAYRILVEKPEGKSPLGRPRHRWGTIIKWILERQDGMT